MNCTSPLVAIDLGINPETGKRRLKIKRPHVDWSLADVRKHYGDVILLPCGHCPSCLLNKRKEWAIRCACESKYHINNCFVTLTYDDAHNPGTLVKKDLQRFIKAIRNLGYQVRYFACGEFSPRGRPHYHAILFGWMPEDMKYSHTSNSGEKIFTSDILSKCWTKGISCVQMFTPAAAGYVAGYTNKKYLDERGFLLMSRRPGIGFHYLQDNFDKLLEYDSIVDDLGSYKIARPSRYFDKLVESFYGPFYLDLIKNKRIEKAKNIKAYEFYVHHYDKEEDQIFSGRSDAQNKLNKLKRVLQ